MSELSTASRLAPDPAELRIRLEGRLETLEAALQRYSGLRQILGADWKRDAVLKQDEIAELCAHEPALEAAASHVAHLAERDGWPPGAEPVRTLARLRGLRAELETRLRKLLKKVAPREPVATWSEALKKLQEVAVAARLPGPHEVVLLSGTGNRAFPLWALAIAPAVIALMVSNVGIAAGWIAAVAALGSIFIRLGRYSLLGDRLVWLPRKGDAFDLPLDSVTAVSLDAKQTRVVIDGRRRLELPVATSAPELAGLITLLRFGPLKGVASPPGGTTLVLPASLVRPGPDVQGTVLVHPGGLCFVPTGSAPGLLAQLCPGGTPFPITEKFLLEQLSRLRGEALSQTLTAAAEHPGVVAATAEQIEYVPGGTPSQLLRVRAQGEVLEVPIGSVDYQAIRTLLPWTQDRSRQVP